MNEEAARTWIGDRFGAKTASTIDRFLNIVIEETSRQNLIAPSTIGSIYARHAVDSLQLLDHMPQETRHWMDVGTGGGFPGMVVALASDVSFLLVEPRRKRAEFLSRCIDLFDMADRVTVACCRVQQTDHITDVISARAVSSIENLLQSAAYCSTVATRWLLPRGRVDEGEKVALRHKWQLMFHVEQSITDPASSIVILDGVQSR